MSMNPNAQTITQINEQIHPKSKKREKSKIDKIKKIENYILLLLSPSLLSANAGRYVSN